LVYKKTLLSSIKLDLFLYSYVDPAASSDPYSTINKIIPWYAVLGASSIVLYWIGYSSWVSF
jgi:hypothetical protein